MTEQVALLRDSVLTLTSSRFEDVKALENMHSLSFVAFFFIECAAQVLEVRFENMGDKGMECESGGIEVWQR